MEFRGPFRNLLLASFRIRCRSGIVNEVFMMKVVYPKKRGFEGFELSINISLIRGRDICSKLLLEGLVISAD